MTKVKLSSKGQVLLPKKIREKLKIKAGDELRIDEVENGLLLRPSEKSIFDLGKTLHSKNIGPKTDEEIRKGIEEAATDRYLHR